MIPHAMGCWMQRIDRLEALKVVSVSVGIFAIVAYLAAQEHATNLMVVKFALSMFGSGSVGPDTNPLVVDWVGMAMSVSAVSAAYGFGGGVAVGAVCGRASLIAVIWLSMIFAIASPVYILFAMPDQWPNSPRSRTLTG